MKEYIKDIVKLPNLLSLFRLFSAIAFWIVLTPEGLKNNNLIILLIAFISGASDWADGYFARKMGLVSELGKILDPLADKVVVAVVVLKLFILNYLPISFISIILGRDLLILLAGIIITPKIGKVIPSNMLGKITVSFLSLQMILIFAGIDVENIFYKVLYYNSIFLAFLSLIVYALRAYKIMKEIDESI